VIGPEGSDQVDVGGAGHGGHLGPVGLGDLDREGADTAGGAVDQDLVGGLDGSVVAETLEGGDRRHRHGRRLLERQAGRLQRHGVHRHRGVFGEAAVAVVQEVGIDLVAGLEPGDAAAGRLHLPGDVDARILWFGRSRPRVARENRGLPRSTCQSAALTDAASTLTRTSSAFGAGLSTSAIRSVSGGPYLS
jgi:hypothetical protein